MFWIMIVVAVLALGYGVLSFFAGMMSDAPSQANEVANYAGFCIAFSIIISIAAGVLRYMGVL